MFRSLLLRSYAAHHSRARIFLYVLLFPALFLMLFLTSNTLVVHAQEQTVQYIVGVQQLHRTPNTTYSLATKKTEEQDKKKKNAKKEANQSGDPRRTMKVTRVKNPVMRVLLGEAASTNTFTVNGAFVVEDESQQQLLVGAPNKIVSITYAEGVYTATLNEQTVTATTPLRVTPAKYRTSVTVTSYENRPAWNPDLNDNQFYGSVEVVWSEQSQQLLLVNELGIEKYVRGIAEAGNENNAHYLQALLTASRTYALYNIMHPTKHKDEPYILDASANDQVYRGAGFSLRAPNVIAAQQSTARQVITYANTPIIAPYFSQSDGRTRAWDEVWKGAYAWSQAVDDPCCSDQELKGHGVGMSAAGARYFAEQQGWTWQQILNYYYTDVSIEEAY